GTHIQFTNYNFLIFGMLLVLMMLFRREGFLPERRTRMILKEPARTELEAVGSDAEAGQEFAPDTPLAPALVGESVGGDGRDGDDDGNVT
ncbi:MAG: hypothetical protein QOD45_819, partial [Pseudonocardiales bacterium]|nr:hypothetical protein [Pseudonocardiales bacterium]